MALVDENGTEAAAYRYDPYGRVIYRSSDLASTNPLRYRGYYQDTETGFYYLQSRYYDPEICRFINADAYASTGQGILGCNMYAYCNNNPSSTVDFDGYCSKFLGFLCKIDCNDPTCQTSSSYNPNIANMRDVSEEIDTALRFQFLDIHRKFNDGDNCASGRSNIEIFIVKLKYFYNIANHKNPWDIKRPQQWEGTIGTAFPGVDVEVIYHGKIMTPEELGNYCYGYLGHKMGFPLELLYAGSYYAADFPYMGDAFDNEMRDWKYIKKGYEYT